MANLVAADLRTPKGWIEASHFPAWKGTTLSDNLLVWLGIAYADPRVIALGTEPERNAAARSYSYFRAADQIAKNLHRQAAQAQNQGQGSKTHTEPQFAYWEKEAAKYLAEFETAVTPDEDELLEPESISPTFSLETEREY